MAYIATVTDGERITEIKGDNYDELMDFIDTYGFDVLDVEEITEPEPEDLKG